LLAVGPYSATLQAGSFKQGPSGTYVFEGTVNGAQLAAAITQTATLRYAFTAGALGTGANVTGGANPVSVSLTIGNDGGNQVTVKPSIINY
jgi:hypothetical protein